MQTATLAFIATVGGSPVPAESDGTAWPFSALFPTAPVWAVDANATLAPAADGSSAVLTPTADGTANVTFTGVNVAGATVSASVAVSIVAAVPVVDGGSISVSGVASF